MNELAEIEARRRALGLSVDALERAAQISVRYYHSLLSGFFAPRPATLARLKLALQRHRLRQAAGDEQAFVTAVAYRMAVAIAAHALGQDPAKIHGFDPARRATRDPDWKAAADVRRIAVYLMNCGAGFSQTDVARAAGLTKQAVSLAVREIEERCEDGSPFEAMLERLRAQIMGEW